MLAWQTVDDRVAKHRELGSLAALTYVLLCPQHAWLQARLLMDGDGASFCVSWLLGIVLFQWCWRVHLFPLSPSTFGGSTDLPEGEDILSEQLTDATALLAWDQRFTLRQSSVQQLKVLARCVPPPARALACCCVLQAFLSCPADCSVKLCHQLLLIPFEEASVLAGKWGSQVAPA